MKQQTVGTMILALVVMMFAQVAVAKAPPVAKLVQVEGQVEYTRNGSTWHKVTRTKYLFAGYKIRTGADGRGKLINQQSGMSQKLGGNSVISVTAEGVDLLSGNLTTPKEESTSLFESLMNKFAKAQRYTTVRRSATTMDDGSCDNKVRTIKNVTLSPSHPDLVWRNACPEFSYKLVIDDQEIHIPAQATAEMIRFKVEGIKPGEHSYRVEVMDKDGTVYIPRADSKFVYLTGKEDKTVRKQLGMADGDPFVETALLEEKGMHIAAMDTYRGYFQENPDDNDMRPLLIQSYQTLKLTDLRESEARLYNAALEQDF